MEGNWSKTFLFEITLGKGSDQCFPHTNPNGWLSLWTEDQERPQVRGGAEIQLSLRSEEENLDTELTRNRRRLKSPAYGGGWLWHWQCGLCCYTPQKIRSGPQGFFFRDKKSHPKPLSFSHNLKALIAFLGHFCICCFFQTFPGDWPTWRAGHLYEQTPTRSQLSGSDSGYGFAQTHTS